MTVRFDLTGEPFDVPMPYEVALLRIAQSGLANTTQHAHATKAEMTLRYADSGIGLYLTDDGVGFDPQSVGYHSGGFGLDSMRARAESLGGTWALESAPGRGTALSIDFPFIRDAPNVSTSTDVSRP